MKFQICIAAFSLLIIRGLAQNGPPAARPEPPPTPLSQKPFGPYYCQAMCLASCLETFLAPNLEDCQKFCPPFDENTPCKPDDADCWRTCGIPAETYTSTAPDATTNVKAVLDGAQENDPYLIQTGWTAVPNASLYIVEFYPINRTPRPGEKNFFQAMTTSLTYTVLKEDECTEYDARVIAVNAYGISEPTYAYLSAPVPAMNGEHFAVRAMQRDPWSEEMVTVTIDYSFPLGWPANDIDIDGLRVAAVDCRGPLGTRTFGVLDNPANTLNPSFNAIIGKVPTTAIQLSFFQDVVQSNCLFQMRVISLTTRCNTTITYDDNSLVAPGIDFRISCGSIEGFCNDTSTLVPPSAEAPIPVPATTLVDSDALNLPGYLPPGISQPPENVSTGQDMPTPPPLPLFIIGESQQAPNEQPMPPSSGMSVSVIDIAPNGTSIQTMEVPQAMLPPLCDLDMLDVVPSLNPLSQSLVDLTVVWLERQPLPPPPPASYFTIRYGPTIRKLVDDDRQQNEIIPGYETIMRTGQQQLGQSFPDPTRQINMSGIQRGSLLKIQICAIFDANSEPLIQWDSVSSHRIDLAALEPFLDLESNSPSPVDIQDALAAAVNVAMPPAPSPPPAQATDDDTVDVPVIIAVVNDPNASAAMYWISVMGGLTLMMLTAVLVFICLRRMCGSRRMVKHLKTKEPMYFVNTVSAPPPTINEVVKVPLP
jgi:hypothetical protein